MIKVLLAYVKHATAVVLLATVHYIIIAQVVLLINSLFLDSVVVKMVHFYQLEVNV